MHVFPTHPAHPLSEHASHLQCDRGAAAQASKDTAAERPARESTESCVSSLCFDLPSSLPPSYSSKASATSLMSPPPCGGVSHAAAAAATRGDGATGGGSTGKRSSNECGNSAAESDSPWSLRALSSAELSPVSLRDQTPGSSPAAAVGVPPSATHNGAAAASAGSVRVGVEHTPAASSARNRSAAGGRDACDEAHDKEQRGRGEHPRRGPASAEPSAEPPSEPPAAATGNGDGETSGLRAERAGRASQKLAPRPAPLEATRSELPGEDADDEDEETADGPEAGAAESPRRAAESGGSLRAGGAEQMDGRYSSRGRVSSGAAAGCAEHRAEHAVAAVSGSGPRGGGSGGAQGSSLNGEKEAGPTPPNANTGAMMGPKAAVSSAAREPAGAALSTPSRAAGNGGSTGGSTSRSSSNEKPCFTNGAPLTNWAAGVCGRGELLSYPGEGEMPQERPAPARTAAATACAAPGGAKALAGSLGAGDPVATVSRREGGRASGDAPGTSASAGPVGRRDEKIDGGPLRRAGGEAQGPKRAASSASAHQLAFTSEEESCGNGAPGDAGDSVVSEASPGKLFATPSPPPPPASMRVGICRDADDRGRGVEAERAASSRVAIKTAGALGAAGAALPVAAKMVGKSGRVSDRRRREEEGVSAAPSPPRSPAAVLAAADKAASPLSPLVPSPDATQTPVRDGTRAVSSAAMLARAADCANKHAPSSAGSRPPAAPRPPAAADKGKAREEAGEARAAAAASADAPDPRPAAALTLVPARPSAGGWFSSRRAEGCDGSPLTACSQASLGGGGTATQSPDLLAEPAGLGGATAAAARGGPAGRGGGSPQPQRRPAAEGCPASSVGRGSERGVAARSTAAPPRCDGISMDHEAAAPRGGGGGGGPSCAASTATATAAAVVAEVGGGRRDETRGEKRTRGGGGVLQATEEHVPRARSRGLAIGGEQDPGEGKAGDSFRLFYCPRPPSQARRSQANRARTMI